MKISPARTAAFDVLLRIETQQAFSSVLLPQYEERLETKDRALCHELVLGVLRRQLYLDRLIDRMSKAKKLDVEVRLALRIGLYQLFFLTSVAPHAVVNESVELVVRAKRASARSFVNAILRGATRDTPTLIFDDDIDRISTETSHPRWLIDRWTIAYGPVDAAAIAEANDRQPQLCFRIIDQNLSPLSDWEISDRVLGCYRAPRMTDQLRSLAKAGQIYFQEEASQLVASAVEVLQKGKFLDVCAAPGGKTGGIAIGQADLSLVVAGDLHWARVIGLRDNLRKQDLAGVKVVQYDATVPLPFANGSFDTILVDVPCTGTGTIRSNPEIRYFLKPDDVSELSRKQQQILQNASKLVKTGGRLVYSTCSLEKEEGEGVIAAFLEETTGFVVKTPNVSDQFITDERFARTRPDRDRMDGFFVAVLENIGF